LIVVLVAAVFATNGPVAEAVEAERPLPLFRFSPDGRYVLAQDETEIALLTVKPLAVLFKIPAEGATECQFRPDSQQVVFVSSATRARPGRVSYIRSAAHVERWSIADGIRIGYQELPEIACGTMALSPDGRSLACDDFEGTLRLIDVDAAVTVFERKEFVKLIPVNNMTSHGVDLPNGQFLGDLGGADLDFSPDGCYLTAIPQAAGKDLAYDLCSKAPVDLTRRTKRPLFGRQVFLAPHNLLFSGPGYGARHGVVPGRIIAFPSGTVLSRPKIPVGGLYRTADPNFVLIWPFGLIRHDRPIPNRAAAVEISTGDAIISETPRLDVFGRYYVSDPSPGEIGLYERGKGLQATVALHKK
jgi:hypothetical protein